MCGPCKHNKKKNMFQHGDNRKWANKYEWKPVFWANLFPLNNGAWWQQQWQMWLVTVMWMNCGGILPFQSMPKSVCAPVALTTTCDVHVSSWYNMHLEIENHGLQILAFIWQPFFYKWPCFKHACSLCPKLSYLCGIVSTSRSRDNLRCPESGNFGCVKKLREYLVCVFAKHRWW